jgi:hypothetical protein
MMVAGAAGELANAWLMERRLGLLAEPYRQGRAGRYARLAKTTTAAGAALAIAARRRRAPGRIAAGLILGGAIAERFAIFRAGFQSAEDPRHVIRSQRG